MPGSTPSRVEIDNLGIPPLAGICSYAEAAEPGTVGRRDGRPAQALRLRLRRLHEVGAAHLPRRPNGK